MRVGYRYNIVDIHSHIVPGVDDGAEDIEESMDLLRMARDEGVRDVIATPHYGIQNGFAPDVCKVRAAFDEVKEAKDHGSESLHGLRVYLGEEVYCSDDVAEQFKKGEVLRINNTRFALVEFLEYGGVYESGKDILERLEKLKKNAYVTPILAHAERYTTLQGDHDYLKRIQDLGVLIQVNAFDLALSQNCQTKETAQWLAEQRMISFIGSDMHGRFPKREPKMRAGVDWLYQHTDDEYADCVVRKNAEKLLRIKKYEPWDQRDYSISSRIVTYCERDLCGMMVRCQAFPSGGENRIGRTVVQLDDGRAYAFIEGMMGTRVLRLEAYADENNSYFGFDDTGWYWRWKCNDRDVILTNLHGNEF